MKKNTVGNKDSISQRFMNALKRVGNMVSLSDQQNPMEPITKKERLKRNKKQKMRSDSRRKNRTIRNGRPVPKPGQKRYP